MPKKLPPRPDTSETPADGDLPLYSDESIVIEDEFGNDLWPLQIGPDGAWYGPGYTLTRTGQKLNLEFNRKYRKRHPSDAALKAHFAGMKKYKATKQAGARTKPKREIDPSLPFTF